MNPHGLPANPLCHNDPCAVQPFPHAKVPVITASVISSSGRCEPYQLILRFQYIPPGQNPLHQGPHAQLAGDGQGLVQQGHGLLSVACLVTLEEVVGVVAAGPGQLGPVARFAAECQGVVEVAHGLAQISHCLGEEAQQVVSPGS